jgi:hypothetical protein
MNSIDSFLVFWFFVSAVATAIYTVAVWNDFSSRRASIIAMWANVCATRKRRRGVNYAISNSVQTAVRFEKDVASVATRRGRNARLASDIANRWPATTAVATVSNGMSTNVASWDLENKALQVLHDQAMVYNQRLASIPRGFVGQMLGFRQWRFKPNQQRNTPQGRR